MKNIILSIVLLFSFTGCADKQAAGMMMLLPFKAVNAVVMAPIVVAKKTKEVLTPKVQPKEVLTEKQVLVYDKTISIPISYRSYLQFSPTNSDELATGGRSEYYLVDLKNSSVEKELKFNESEYSYVENSNYREFYDSKAKNTSIRASSLDKQYILLLDSTKDDKKDDSKKIKNYNYRVYDLKNRKTIHNLGDLFPNNKHYEYLFLSNNKIAFKYLSEDSLAYLSAKPLTYLSSNPLPKKNWYISVIDLTTKEKKSVQIPNYTTDWVALNSRYILWKNKIENQGLINIFDTKKMKIVQQLTYSTKYDNPNIAISQKHKKLAFAHRNNLYLYNIVEE